MSIFKSMQINASGLTLERLKMDTISSNISNANTTRTEDGGPYRRKIVDFRENLQQAEFKIGSPQGRESLGVSVVGIIEDRSELRLEYNPSHPDADENGYVSYPNVNMVDEMIDLMKAQRIYEANVTAFNVSKSMMKKALEISKG